MADKPDPDKLTGPGGMTMRQLHERVKQSAERDRDRLKAGHTTGTTAAGLTATSCMRGIIVTRGIDRLPIPILG